MGVKGDKHTNEAQLSAEFLVEKLSEIDGITSKKMFGGHGIFHEGKMFGIVDSKGQTYLKTNEESVDEYVKKGAIPHGKMPYHSIPEGVLSAPSELIRLARKSIEISK
ncbi:MAG: TfoX/Sxy family protein [Cyclobacteriaceae bacterium]